MSESKDRSMRRTCLLRWIRIDVRGPDPINPSAHRTTAVAEFGGADRD
jgi:hypothetical protein